jgi:mycothiol synthase
MSSSRLRPLRSQDAERVASLFDEAYGDDRRLDAEEIRSWLRNEEFEPEWFQVLEEGGRVVGYGDIWVQEDEVALDVAAPGRWSSFFDWAESAARERGRSRVRVNPPAGHEVAAIAEKRGYRPWRSSFTMEIDLHERPQAPPGPDGLTLRSYEAADEQTLRAALNAAFADDPFWHTVTPSNFREFYLRARGFDPSLWLLAWNGADLAGFVLGYPERSGDMALGWVGTLGVPRAWRRRGLGEALLRHAFAKLYDRGLRRVGLGVDAENVTGALRLYERVGMRKTRQVDNWVLDL